MKLSIVLYIFTYWLWTKYSGKCIIDMNMSHFQYISNNLRPEECRKLVAALHFDTFDMPNAVQQAERKVPKDESCLQQLMHWNSETKGKPGTSHEVLARRLKQVERRDLALWLTNATYEGAHKTLDNFASGESFQMYQPIVLPYVPFTLEPESTPAQLRITTPETLIRVIKQNPADPTENIVVDPTEWTIFDTISWTIVIILFLLVIILLVYLIRTSPCNRKNKNRCQCNVPSTPPPVKCPGSPPCCAQTKCRKGRKVLPHPHFLHHLLPKYSHPHMYHHPRQENVCSPNTRYMSTGTSYHHEMPPCTNHAPSNNRNNSVQTNTPIMYNTQVAPLNAIPERLSYSPEKHHPEPTIPPHQSLEIHHLPSDTPHVEPHRYTEDSYSHENHHPGIERSYSHDKLHPIAEHSYSHEKHHPSIDHSYPHDKHHPSVEHSYSHEKHHPSIDHSYPHDKHHPSVEHAYSHEKHHPIGDHSYSHEKHHPIGDHSYSHEKHHPIGDHSYSHEKHHPIGDHAYSHEKHHPSGEHVYSHEKPHHFGDKHHPYHGHHDNIPMQRKSYPMSDSSDCLPMSACRCECDCPPRYKHAHDRDYKRTQSYLTMDTYDRYDAQRTKGYHGSSVCPVSECTYNDNGITRTIDIHQKIAIPRE